METLFSRLTAALPYISRETGSADGGSSGGAACASRAWQEAHLLSAGVPGGSLERLNAPALRPHKLEAWRADAREQRQPYLQMSRGMRQAGQTKLTQQTLPVHSVHCQQPDRP